MHVLHVWNTAGVASVIAKFTDRNYGTVSTVIARKRFDRMGLTDYGRAYGDSAALFFLRALWMARGKEIVHVHSLDRIVPWAKRLTSSRPVVMHYHGTDILGRWEEKMPRWDRADFVAYSTPNLADGSPQSSVFMPDPVDTDLFRNLGRHQEHAALHVRYGAEQEAKAVAEGMGLNVEVLDRTTNPVPYHDMPDLLNRYEYYIDIKRAPGSSEGPLHSLSKTGLEALACGCLVVDWSGAVHKGLPSENDPARVAERWHEIYLSLSARA